MIFLLVAILIGICLIIKLEIAIFIIISIVIFFICKKLKVKYTSEGRFINIKSKSDYINFTIKTLILFIVIGFLFYIFTYIKIYSFDFKYQTNIFNEKVVIISKEKSTEFYNQYLCKNENRDKFILNVNKSIDIGLETNNEIYINGYFELPSLQRNEGGFNYRRYLNSKNIYGIITVKSGKINLISEGKIDFITKIKRKIEHTFINLLPQNQAGIINGMINGETKNVSEDILKDFKNSGITHLLAVSGSNISYIIMFLSIILNKVFRKKFIILFYNNINNYIYFCFWSFCFCCTCWNNGDFKYYFNFII